MPTDSKQVDAFGVLLVWPIQIYSSLTPRTKL